MKYTVEAIIGGERYVYAREVGLRNFPWRESLHYEISSGIVRGARSNGRNLIHEADARLIDALSEIARERGEEHHRVFVFDPLARAAGYPNYRAAMTHAIAIHEGRK